MRVLSRTLGLAIWTAVILMLSCCSRTQEAPSLAQVPAESDYVAFINADSLPVASLLPDHASQLLVKLSSALKLSDVMVYKPAVTRQPVAAVAIKDEKTLTEALEANGYARVKTDGITAYRIPDAGDFSPCLVIEDNALWLLATKADIANWQQSRKQAEKENFEKFGLEKLMEKESQLTAFILPGALGFGKTDAILRITATSTADSMEARINLVSLNTSDFGSNIPLGGPVAMTDLSFISSMPSDNGLIIAGGFSDAINWGALVDMIGQGLDTRNQGLLQALVPYMGSLRGSMAIGVGPFTAEALTDPEIESQRIVIYAAMEGDKASDAVEEINTNLREKGLSPRPRPDNVYAYTLGDNSYRYTARNGVFSFALNRELGGNSSIDSTMFAGKQAVVMLNLPPLSALIPGADKTGPVNALLTLTPEGCIINLKAPGAQRPLDVLAKYFSELSKAADNRRQQAPDYYDTYD